MITVKRLPPLFVKWLSNQLGYKIIMLRAKDGCIDIEGDGELLRYTDASGYFFKKEPLIRI